jgi:hypothetical protein
MNDNIIDCADYAEVKAKKKLKKRYLLIIPLVFAVLAAIALNPAIQTTYYHIESDKIESPVKIALITDLHGTVYGNHNHRLLKKISEGNPDIIVFAGDIFCCSDDFQRRVPINEFIYNCTKIAPTYFVEGNHETANSDFRQILNEVREAGAQILNDGILDLYDYRIMVSHYPMHFKYHVGTVSNIDLMLAGHTHGGQVRIPLLYPKGLYSPDQGWFPEYTGGKYEINDDFTMIVSRGLSRVGPGKFRVFNRPELVFITVG